MGLYAPFFIKGEHMYFKVNNNLWNIKFVNSNNTNLRRSNNTYTLGVTDNNDKTIFLSNQLSGYMLNKVLCHELTHVFCFEYDYCVNLKTEEIIADFMSLYGKDIVLIADDIMNSFLRRLINER